MTVRSLPYCPPSLFLAPEATVGEAIDAMIRNAVNHLPICSAEGRFMGLIGSHDILLALLPASARVEHGVANLSFVGDGEGMLLDHLRTLRARPALALVRSDDAPLRPDTPLIEAARLLAGAATPLPIVDPEGRLLGMLSRRAIIGHLLGQARD
jgi:CBS domain-containing protein